MSRKAASKKARKGRSKQAAKRSRSRSSEPATISGQARLAEVFGRSQKTVSGWINRHDWPFGRGPWPVAMVPRILEWLETHPHFRRQPEHQRFGQPVPELGGWNVPEPLATGPLAVAGWLDQVLGEIPAVVSWEKVEELSSISAAAVLEVVMNENGGEMPQPYDQFTTPAGWQRYVHEQWVRSGILEDRVARINAAFAEMTREYLENAGVPKSTARQIYEPPPEADGE